MDRALAPSEHGGHRLGSLALVLLGPIVAVFMFFAELPLADLADTATRGADGYYPRWVMAVPLVGLGVPLIVGTAISARGLAGVTRRGIAMRLLLGFVVTLAGALLIGVLLWALGVNIQRSSY